MIKKGFTLIELLVVVLIIGILSAIALPQYQRAVEKARFAALLPLVKAVADAKSEYYLSTGEHARTFDVLAVTLPPEFTYQDDTTYGQRAVGIKKVIRLDAGSHRVVGQLNLSDGSYMLYYMPISEISASTLCAGYQGKRAEALCKTLPGATFSYTDDNNTAWYNINR